MSAEVDLWDMDRYDDRSMWEKFFLPYPRRSADFDDAEAAGLFIPRGHHVIYAVMWAMGLTFLRHAFNRDEN